MKAQLKQRMMICLAGALCLQASAAVFTVTTISDSEPAEPGSLRQAIASANDNSNYDEIHFKIPSGGIQVISPSAALPTITYPVMIRGETQGGDGYIGPPLIELDGSFAGCANGLEIRAGGCTVSGLAIHTFSTCIGGHDKGHQILLREGGTNLIVGCYLGLTASGTTPLDLHYPYSGIMVLNSARNQIGAAGEQRNVIAANGFAGAANLWIEGVGSVDNVVEGNYIGTDPSGTDFMPNQGNGVTISAGASRNRIGGSAAGGGNVISANPSNGVYVLSASRNRIEHNLIGTDVTGMLPLGNMANGIGLETAVTNSILGNVICDNSGSGIFLGKATAASPGSSGNVISNNFVGLGGILGVVGFPLGNHMNGIMLVGDSTEGNTIGDPSGLTVNSIAFNSQSGIATYSPRNAVVGNVVSDNVQDGVTVGAGGDLNTIQQNLLLHNGRDGARFEGSHNRVTGNCISNNLNNGVSVVGAGVANCIRSNSITANRRMGIDLEPVGPTRNDDGDADGGANRLQNSPFLDHAVHGGDSVTVAGLLSSEPRRTFALDFYLNAACDDPYKGGEGFSHIGTTEVTTDDAGNVNFSETFPLLGLAIPGWVITATATSSATDDTSEFSLCRNSTRLSYHRTGGLLRLMWPDTDDRWRLQWSPGFGANAAWQDLGITPVRTNGEYRVIEPLTEGQRFYRLRLLQSPVILQQPQNQQVYPGQTATFSIQAAGSPPLSYQWHHNNAAIAGATSTALTINNALAADAGSYFVIVANADGIVTSAFANLTILPSLFTSPHARKL